MIKKKSNRPEGFCKKGALLKNFGKFTGKHLCPSLFFNKVTEQLQWLVLNHSLNGS